MVAQHTSLFAAMTAILVAVAATALLQPGSTTRPPQRTATLASRVPAMLADDAHTIDSPLHRTLAPNVRGKVVDPRGKPLAGMIVGMSGTTDIVTSAADGSFQFCNERRSRCRVHPAKGWMEIVSPMLDLCQKQSTPTLVVSRCAQVQGRVLDANGEPIVGARVAIEVELPIDGTQSGARGVRSARVRGASCGSTDADGWYLLASAPIGKNVHLVVEHPGCRTERLELHNRQAYVHCILRRTALPAGTAQPIATGHGSVSGWLLDEQEQPRAGWWVAIVADEAADTRSARGTFSRFARLPVLADQNGYFAFAGVHAGSHHIEAWHPHNHGTLRSTAIVAPAADLELSIANQQLPAVIRGRVVDQHGEAIANASVGLARPSGWAVPGHLAMHVHTAVTTDRFGNYEIGTHGLAGLELIVAGNPVVPKRIAIDFGKGEVAIKIRATARRWLKSPVDWTEASRSTPVNLVAVDGEQIVLSTWLATSAIRQDACLIAPGVVFGFPANARELIWREGTRELGRLILQPRHTPKGPREQ